MNRPSINVTPLIDVLLVLLIIFMVVSPMRPSQIETKIPREPDATPVLHNPWTLVVAIDKDRAVSLNDKHNYESIESLKGLTDDLKQVFAKRRGSVVAETPAKVETEFSLQKMVFIKAPKSMSYGNVMKVVDAVKLAGAEPVSLQIDGLEN